jgi:hypothetical protein
VSLESSHICVVDATGRIVREAKVASEPEDLIIWFRSLGVKVSGSGWRPDLCRNGFTLRCVGTPRVRSMVLADPPHWVAAKKERFLAANPHRKPFDSSEARPSPPPMDSGGTASSSRGHRLKRPARLFAQLTKRGLSASGRPSSSQMTDSGSLRAYRSTRSADFRQRTAQPPAHRRLRKFSVPCRE